MRNDLLEQARQLDLTERIELVEAIWDTVDERADADRIAVPDEHRRVLDHRLQRLDEEGDGAIPWGQLHAEINDD